MGSGQPRIIDDLRAYLRAHPQSVSSAQIVAEGFCSSLTLPIFVASEPAGFLFLSSVEPRSYLSGHAHALQDSIGSQLSMVLERQKVGGRQTEGGSRELRVKDLRADLRRARQVQREMLKLHDSKLPGLDVAFACEPAGYVGGDIVDLVKFPDQTTLAFLADAMGHGSDAGLVISAVKGALRAVVAGTRSPGEILGHLNRSMCDMSLTHFATAACMLVNTQERWMDLALAGHYPPILRRAGEAELIEPGLTVAGMPLGIDAREPYSSMRIEFGVGDTLTFFTDGIVEALNPKLHAYGRESIRRIVRENDLQSAGGLIRAIRADFIQHQDGHPTDDDVTLMVIRMT